MTVQELYDLAKENNALDYEIAVYGDNQLYDFTDNAEFDHELDEVHMRWEEWGKLKR